MSKIFDTYLLDELAGHLEIIDMGIMSFTYTPEYFAKYHNAACNTRNNLGSNIYRSISIGMPLQLEPYESRPTIIFLQNLFPEGSIIQKIIEILNIGEDDIDVLLEVMGQDVAGAIAFYPHGYEKPVADPLAGIFPIDSSSLINDIEEKPFLIEEGDEVRGITHRRMSLAGAQPKMPILAKRIDQGQYDLYISESPSSHIIKPPRINNEFPSVVYNEYTCMLAAKLAGIRTPEVDLIVYKNTSNEDTDALIVERYDRVHIMHLAYKRLHQEDFCQILGDTPQNKYEYDYRVKKEGYKSGGGIEDLYKQFFKYSSIPLMDYKECLYRILFNVIVGNDDAHTKNFSYIYLEDGTVELTPAYDIVCTQVYEGLSPNMAMAIGNARKSSEITPEDLSIMFDQMGIEYKPLIPAILKFINKSMVSVEAAAAQAHGHMFLQSDMDLVDRIVRISKVRGEHLIEQFELLRNTQG